jgi:hypothetical protein
VRLKANDARALEDILDRYNLSTVILELSWIGVIKAQHIRDNWNDENLARAWDKASAAVEKCALSDRVTNVP